MTRIGIGAIANALAATFGPALSAIARKATRSLGITAHLLIVALVPALLLFVLVSASLLVSLTRDVRHDVELRGEWLASSIAESVLYGLMTGSAADVRQVIERGRGSPGIVSIEVFDHQHALVGSLEPGAWAGTEVEAWSEVPVTLNALHMSEIYRTEPSRAAGLAWDPGRQHSVGGVIGYVRVGVSPVPVLWERRGTLVFAAVAMVASVLASILVGGYLASQLRLALHDILQSLREIQRGHYDIGLRITDSGEIGEIQNGVIRLAASLRDWQGEMDGRVVERTAALNAALDELAEADLERQRLISRSHALMEEERAGIAADLHDQLNADVVVMKMEASRVSALALQVGDSETAQKIGDSAARIRALTSSLYDRVRAITRRLRPETLDALGLEGAVRDLVHSVADERIKYTIDSQPMQALNGKVAIEGYRIVQEALSNIHKHAAASSVCIQLRVDEGGWLDLVVMDDGCGFDTTRPPSSGLGLIGMRERARSCSGTCEIVSKPLIGTHIHVRLCPIPGKRPPNPS